MNTSPSTTNISSTKNRFIHIDYYATPYGELILGDYEGRLCLCDWRYRKMRDSIDKRLQNGLEASYVHDKTPLTDRAIAELEEYFMLKREQFTLPLNLVGTPFQKSVWKALMEIPYGQTLSYLALSRKLGDEKAIRAVASANGANALSIVVPCHRIIGSKGELTGYAGGLPAKKKLLTLEKAVPAGPQLQLF